MISQGWKRWARSQMQAKRAHTRRGDPWQLWAYNSSRYARRRGMQGVTEGDFLRLAKAAGFKCQLTGLELEPEIASLDHIIAIRRGGPDTLENLQLVHREVNRMKGTLTVAELIEWCKLIIKGS